MNLTGAAISLRLIRQTQSCTMKTCYISPYKYSNLYLMTQERKKANIGIALQPKLFCWHGARINL